MCDLNQLAENQKEAARAFQETQSVLDATDDASVFFQTAKKGRDDAMYKLFAAKRAFDEEQERLHPDKSHDFAIDDVLEEARKLKGGVHLKIWMHEGREIWFHAWHFHDPLTPKPGAPDSVIAWLDFKPAVQTWPAQDAIVPPQI